MAQVISLVAVHKLLWVFIPVIWQILHQPHCLQMFQMRKSVTSQVLIHYRLQMFFQVWFHILELVTSQPMLQVFTQVVDQVMGLLVFQSCILSSTLVYHYQKPYLILPLPISVYFSQNFHHSTLLFILNK